MKEIVNVNQKRAKKKCLQIYDRICSFTDPHVYQERQKTKVKATIHNPSLSFRSKDDNFVTNLCLRKVLKAIVNILLFGISSYTDNFVIMT